MKHTENVREIHLSVDDLMQRDYDYVGRKCSFFKRQDRTLDGIRNHAYEYSLHVLQFF